MSQAQIELTDVGHGDHITVRFDPPLLEDGVEIESAEGEALFAAGQCFLAASSHKGRFGAPRIVDLVPDRISSLVRIETSLERKTRRDAEARGAIVFPEAAADAAGIEAQLSELALMISRETDDRIFGGRKGQLEAQFHDLADSIALAKSKRAYLLTCARVGADFHPWETRHPAVYRNECVRPLPCDFEPEPRLRKDRERRLTESTRIFGQAEAEVRAVGSWLRQCGYEVRRPHPNAQELLIRVRMGPRMSADIRVFPSPNGLWQAQMRAPQNKTEGRAAARCKREGHLRKAEAILEARQQ